MTVFGNGPQVVTSGTRPASPIVGQIIYETDTFSYRWWNGTSWQGVIPVGTVQPFAGVTTPSGWLLCAGSSGTAVTQSAYPDLWSALTNNGSTYPYGGSGATTYTPDLRGRVAAGRDDMGGVTASRLTSGGAGIVGTNLGANGGSQTHTLDTTQMPSHTHIQNSHSHLTFDRNTTFSGIAGGTAAPGLIEAGSRMSVVATTATNQNTGGGLAHQNTQPTIVLNYIIKI